MDWDKAFGIPESLYHPDSDDLLSQAAKQCAGINEDKLSYATEFRAVVEYRKGLTGQAYASLPPNLVGEKPSRTHYDIELVVLEILKATAVCKR